MSPASFPHPKSVLQSRGLMAKKSFGQNFLLSQDAHNQIAQQVKLLKGSASTLVFEIGAGLGALTHALLAQGFRVHAVERDRDLIPILREQFAESLTSGQLVLHEANATTFDYAGCAKALGHDDFVLCGNLPYHLTSQILFYAADSTPAPSGVFLVQKEVADRVVSEPDCRDYGILSILMQAQFHTRTAFLLDAKAFWPPPQVESAVVVLERRAQALITPDEWPKLKHLVKTAFAMRRKTIKNTLKNVPHAQAAFLALGILESARPETLSVQNYIDLMREIEKSHA